MCSSDLTTAIRIDEQVKKLVQDGYDRARKIIEEYKDAMERITAALLEREVLDGSEVRALIAGESLAALPTPPKTPEGGDTQQVIKPTTPTTRLPGMLEGGPQPA